MIITQNYRQLGNSYYDNSTGSLYFNESSTGDNFDYIETGDVIVIGGSEFTVTKFASNQLDGIWLMDIGQMDWHTKKKVIEIINETDYIYSTFVAFDAISQIEIFQIGLGTSVGSTTSLDVDFDYGNLSLISAYIYGSYPTGQDWGAPLNTKTCSVSVTSPNTILITPPEVSVGGEIVKNETPIWDLANVQAAWDAHGGVDFLGARPTVSPRPPFLYESEPEFPVTYLANTSVNNGVAAIDIAIGDPVDIFRYTPNQQFYDFSSHKVGEWTGTAKYLNSYNNGSVINIFDMEADGGAGPILEFDLSVEEEKPIIKRKKNMQIVIAHSGKHWLTFGPLVTSAGVPINGRAAYGFESAKMIVGAGTHSSPATEITEDINADLYASTVSGCYISEFDTTLWTTPGYYRLVITDTPTNMIPHTEEILVVPQAIYDAFINGDIINANNYMKSSLYEAQSAGAVDLTENGVASESKQNTLRDRIEVVQSWVSHGQSMGMAWYVDSVNGDDVNDGKSVGSAFKTINKAITLTSPNSNSIIFVSYGTYYEDIIVPVGCTIRGVANDSTPLNPFPEIRGYASSEYPNIAATSDPTVLLLAGSTLSHVRIGRKESPGNNLPCAVIMHDETTLEHCSMGGINPYNTDCNILISGYSVNINDNVLDTSRISIVTISAVSFMSSVNIKNNIFTGGGDPYDTTTTNYIKLLGNSNFNISDNTFNDVTQGYYAIDGTGNFNVVTFNHHNGYLALGLINPGIGSNIENNGSWVTTDNLSPITSELDTVYQEVVKIWQSTSGIGGAAMRGTDNVGSISADILATNSTLYKSGTTIKDIEVRDNTVYLTYRDPADGKMKTYSRPFTQDIIIASGGSL